MNRGSWSRAIWSGFLSLLSPGLGQVHARAWRLGYALVGLNVVGGLVFGWLTLLRPTPGLLVGLLAGTVLFLPSVYIGSAVDAILRTRRTGEFSRPPWWRSTWFVALIVVALDLGSRVVAPVHWRTFSIPSGSNSPTLVTGDKVIVRLAQDDMPKRGYMIVFSLPRSPDLYYVRRVVGVGGDHVQMRHGQLVLNGAPVARAEAGQGVVVGDTPSVRRFRETLPDGPGYFITKMIDDGPQNDTAEYVVPEGNLFTLGDNRDNSLDSRMQDRFGYVPAANVMGRVEMIVWAADRSRILGLVE